VVFNGEIYNYKALEQEYQLTNLKSTSDTEVLVHLLDVLGIEQTMQQLNGMFAICIVDTLAHSMVLARDFAGIKPLFYGVSEKGVIAASQFNQVFKHPWLCEQLQLRPDMIKAYFGCGYMPAPNTVYEQIFQLDPGELIEITSKGAISKQRFKSFSSSGARFNDASNTLQNTNALLHTAVKQQLVSDVPLGAFLSGGIDSPLIAALAHAHSANLEAFTMSVADEILDESEAAKAYASHLQMKHTVTSLDENELLLAIDEHFKYLPEPFGDYSSIPTYMLTKQAKHKNTVMLSGDGGDELYFGYPRMLDVYKHRHWFKIPYFIRKPLVRACIKLKLMNTWGPFQYRSIGDWIQGKQSYIFKDTLDKLIPNTDVPEAFTALYAFGNRLKGSSLLKQLRANEFYGHMQRVLVKVDRMSMANSLEVRVPFLDVHVIEAAFKTLPKPFKKQTHLKQELKQLMTLYYPEGIVSEDKKGFAVPIERWLRNQLLEDLTKVVFETPIFGATHIQVEVLRTYVSDFLNHKHHAAWGVWHIYAWQKWALTQQLLNT
jgi:asparagine synthase (glutamine-hydrolysing)